MPTTNLIQQRFRARGYSRAFLGLCCCLLIAAFPAPSALASSHEIAEPSQGYERVIAELYDDELDQFHAFYKTLTPEGIEVFTRLVAHLDEGQRGPMGLLLARSQTEPAQQFLALFGSFDEDEFDLVSNHFRLRPYSDWEAAIELLSFERMRDVRGEFLRDESRICVERAPADPIPNTAGGQTGEIPPPICSVPILRFRYVFFSRALYVTRGFDVSAATAPWQGQVSLFGASTNVFRSDEERAKQKAQFGRELDDWEINHICGAVYIGDRFILTAAHCAVSSLSNRNFFAGRRIRLGTNEIGDLKNMVAIRTVITHRDYNSRTLRNDIALIQLASEPQFTNVRKAKLPPSKDHLPRPGQLLLSGWGFTRSTESAGNARALDGQFQSRASETLQGGMITLFAPEKCNNHPAYRSIRVRILPGQLCAGSRTGVDSCRGDSGGPLVDLKTKTLIGLVSGGKGCGIVGRPKIYVDVAYYLDWIKGAKNAARRASNKTRRTFP